jgi:hypothetical protein
MVLLEFQDDGCIKLKYKAKSWFIKERPVSDIKSQGQPASQEDRKKCKGESINVMHECDVERMYAVYRVL